MAPDLTQALMSEFGRTTLPRLRNLARQAQMNATEPTDELLKRAFASGLDALWILDNNGNLIRGGVVCDDQQEDRREQLCERVGGSGTPARTPSSGIEIREAQVQRY